MGRSAAALTGQRFTSIGRVLIGIEQHRLSSLDAFLLFLQPVSIRARSAQRIASQFKSRYLDIERIAPGFHVE
jgi:hypothetical protein